MNKTFDELIENVKGWADDKGILKSENAPKQLMKVMEELGETAGAIVKNKATEEIQDGIGDTFVTLIILSYQLGLEPTACLDHAWNVIKDRKGKTQNGVFVKEEDND
jgi:NTP pyrophosphatase (non-canonical NTP hydrolase)